MRIIKSWNEVPLIIDAGYAADLLGVTDETIKRGCRNGSIKAFKIGNGHWRIAKDEIMRVCGAKAAPLFPE